ncbi:glycosyltransferase family 4 protein [Anabaena sp. FACHB-1237]|uniref:glycosyltransferase family 4 protein n=1 Tax=Anabaena sp. FACHB-1237 TaxID=2692769 RepID=UPI001681ADB5|nr:glycosyltransferase family 4 protein [Anabaena sp. FACHB-1237]MBD2138028.1 glycosyltransferase family 4 protein [Anabaena sp. FACHB-1237]
MLTTNETKVDQERIYHCSGANIRGGGGLETYIASLINWQNYQLINNGVQPEELLISSLKNVQQNQFELLHIHDPDMLVDFREECPAVLTIHNHSSYCPSGTKYLADRQQKCDRSMHPLGCTWGHLIDGCGSRKPQNIFQDWQNAYYFLKNIKNLNISVIANSNYVREELISHGLSPNKVTTLHCGIERSKHPVSPLNPEIHQQQHILFVGRIVPYKGLEWLIKALAKTDSQIHLDIAGDGWGKAKMIELAQKMGLSDRITWHGWCNGDKLEILYQQCFSVIFPSLWPEPAGLVTLEAYAHCRPIIASDIGGIPEYIQNHHTGILVPPHDLQKLADAINELSENYHQARLIGENSHDLFEQKFVMDVHIQELEKIYNQTMNDFYSRKK